MFKRDRFIKIVLLLLTLVAIFGMFAGGNEPIIGILRGTPLEPYLYQLNYSNSIIFNLSVGYLVSVFFWLLVVYYPEQHRRHILRDNLNLRYKNFKEDTIHILLQAAGTYDSSLPKELCDHQKFKEFFYENKKEHWYAALNGLQSSKGHMDDLLLELELLAHEVSYALNNISIQDTKVHAFFKRLNEHIYRLKNANVYSYDQVKYLGNFLWEIHTWWSCIYGQRKNDVIQNMIDDL